MADEEQRQGTGKKSWLSEHDTIQNELLKMKKELLQEKGPKVEDPKVDAVVNDSFTDEKKEADTPSAEPPTKQTDPETIPSPQGEMTIKQMLGVQDEDQKEPENEKTMVEPAPASKPKKLEEGKIPASPMLSSKIANVLQLENNLKRRKFELEKKQRQSSIPPPPRPPAESEMARSSTASPKEVRSDTKQINKTDGLPSTPPVIAVGPSSKDRIDNTDAPQDRSKVKKVIKVKRGMPQKEGPEGKSTSPVERSQVKEGSLEERAKEKEKLDPLKKLRNLLSGKS